MRWFILSALAVSLTATLQAHHPDRENHRVHPYYDLIGPLGTHLPMSYRRKYNRPTNIGGKIAYYIAPSSQEAMAWHSAKHRCLYKNHRPRIVTHYFYPKPWEALKTGARTDTSTAAEFDDVYQADAYQLDSQIEDATDVELVPQPSDQPIASDLELIEQ